VAREYICRQLRLIGSAAAVPALAALLPDPHVSHAARIALEALPAPAPARALREALPRLEGPVRLGVVDSLGRLRDRDAVAALQPLVAEADAALAGAAAAALGRIGTLEAAAVLRPLLARAPEPLRPALAEAGLVCAGHLRDAGQPDLARTLCGLLDDPRYADHVRQAAVRAGR
jgi:HEAT repeat protein